MNKAQLISTLASTTNLTRRDADVAVNSIFNLIIEQLRQGDKVQIVGFGCFEVRERPARKGRNPMTGEAFRPHCMSYSAAFNLFIRKGLISAVFVVKYC